MAGCWSVETSLVGLACSLQPSTFCVCVCVWWEEDWGRGASELGSWGREGTKKEGEDGRKLGETTTSHSLAGEKLRPSLTAQPSQSSCEV